MQNHLSHGTFLHFGLIGSRYNICYYHQDLHYCLFPVSSHSTLHHKQHALLLIVVYETLPQWSGIGYRLERDPFSGLIHSAGELLHTP